MSRMQNRAPIPEPLAPPLRGSQNRLLSDFGGGVQNLLRYPPPICKGKSAPPQGGSYRLWNPASILKCSIPEHRA